MEIVEKIVATTHMLCSDTVEEDAGVAASYKY